MTHRPPKHPRHIHQVHKAEAPIPGSGRGPAKPPPVSREGFQPWTAGLFSPRVENPLFDDLDDPSAIAFIEHYLQLADKVLATEPAREAWADDDQSKVA